MTQKNSLPGIACVVLACGAFVLNDTCMKLVMADAPPLEVIFMRGVAASLCCLPLVLALGYAPFIRHAANRWVVARALFEAFAVLCFSIALAQMPIADITAIYQTAPLLVVGGVSLIWGERIGPTRIVLISLGIAGALLVAQPGATAASPLALLGFGTSIGAAARDIISRKVRQDIPALIVTFAILIIVMAVTGIASALFEDWVPPQPKHLVLVLVAGALLVGAQFAIFFAYRLTNARTLAPFYYSSTIWAVLSGLAVFSQTPNNLAIVGIMLILCSGLAVIAIDRRRHVAAATQA